MPSPQNLFVLTNSQILKPQSDQPTPKLPLIAQDLHTAVALKDPHSNLKMGSHGNMHVDTVMSPNAYIAVHGGAGVYSQAVEKEVRRVLRE